MRNRSVIGVSMRVCNGERFRRTVVRTVGQGHESERALASARLYLVGEPMEKQAAPRKDPRGFVLR